ncbi:tudor domain-containing 6-like [Polymixia lowei]
MCSVAGFPTPGSEVGLSVLIKRVKLSPSGGFVELWINIHGEQKSVYEKTREKTVSVRSQSDVLLLDERQAHITTKSTLALGQNDRFLLPPEMESCVLANVLSIERKWSEKAAKFLKSLLGKRFNGSVQDVLMPNRTILLDIPVVSRYMCMVGFAKKIGKGQFKCLVLSSLHSPKGEACVVCPTKQEQKLENQFEQYFYPELLTGLFETVEVTEVTDKLHIFCKLSIFSKELKKLSEQIQRYYEDGSSIGRVQLKTCGAPCAARASNGKWCRSLLTQDLVAGDGAAEVLHVDRGKTELVPVGDIRPLHERFLRMPVVTYRCSLDGLQKEENDLQSLVESLNKPQSICAIPVAFGDLHVGDLVNAEFPDDSCWYRAVVRDKLDDKNVHVEFIDFGNEATIPCIKTRYLDEEYTACPSYSKPDILHNRPREVYATCISGPHFFWCQNANSEDLTKVSKLAQEVGRAEQQDCIGTLDPGSPCLALFDDDEQWYRAQVIRKTGNTFFVLFIDYGNESEVDIKDLRSVPPMLLDKAPQAFLCSLDGFNESSGTWEDDTLDVFYNLLVDKPLNVTALNMEVNLESAVPQYTVKVECGEIIVNEVMEKYWEECATIETVSAVHGPESG